MNETDAQREALKQISEKMKAAHALIGECEKIADEHKVAFCVGIGNVHNEYIPEGAEIDEETGEYPGEVYESEYGEPGGWQQSMC